MNLRRRDTGNQRLIRILIDHYHDGKDGEIDRVSMVFSRWDPGIQKEPRILLESYQEDWSGVTGKKWRGLARISLSALRWTYLQRGNACLVGLRKSWRDIIEIGRSGIIKTKSPKYDGMIFDYIKKNLTLLFMR
ncbi:hypothetical protein Bca52824_027035 [Brassica carinata]|uniref:Uncharacterized protein n=1 Tax=Brassica carinata TaxID=52824 RepID=A0A8X7SJK2_BRACI|nr:hypothetical protein Bca52824_027035 [Brassica carinata]